MAKIITVSISKGGAGKTMSVFSLAGILGEMGKKVLCIDVDYQGNLTSHFGIDRTNPLLMGVERVFLDFPGDVYNDIIIKAPIKELPTVDLLPSAIGMHEANDQLHFAPAKELKLKFFIEENQARFDEYDYVLIDTCPVVTPLNINAFVVADEIIMPVSPDKTNEHGIATLCSTWDKARKALRLKDNIAAVFVVNYYKVANSDKSFVEDIKSNTMIKDILLKTIIPRTTSLKDSTAANKPINIYNKKSLGYVGYYDLVQEMFKEGIL